MAELGITCPVSSSSGGSITTEKLFLIRTGDVVPAGTTIDINAPGVGWTSVGGPVSVSGVQEFIDDTQTFTNGILQLPGSSGTVDKDVFFVSAVSNLSFVYDIRNSDILQFLKVG